MIRKPYKQENPQKKKQKKTQVDDMKILPKIIIISTGYFFLGEKESLLNKKSTNYKKNK